MTEDKTARPEWWGEDVTDRDGDLWHYVPGRDCYALGPALNELEGLLEECAPITPVDPCVTWRADGTGCTWDELMAVCAEGRRAQFKWTTFRGGQHALIEPLTREELVHPLFSGRKGFDSITVWGEPIEPMPDWWGAKVIRYRYAVLIWDDTERAYYTDGDRENTPVDDPSMFTESVTVLVDAAGQWVGDQA